MSKRAKGKDVTPSPRGRTRAVILLGLAVVILGGGGAWWVWSNQNEVTAGTPRLAVDRTEIDLGYRRFDTAARVVFTLTNAGDGPLRLAEVPRVKAVQGC
jgi:hypothetical protein